MRFPMQPLGTKIAASLPKIFAARFSRRFTLGSSRYTSSPTSASAIARRMAAVGRVTVSLRRSTMLAVLSVAIQITPLLPANSKARQKLRSKCSISLGQGERYRLLARLTLRSQETLACRSMCAHTTNPFETDLFPRVAAAPEKPLLHELAAQTPLRFVQPAAFPPELPRHTPWSRVRWPNALCR